MVSSALWIRWKRWKLPNIRCIVSLKHLSALEIMFFMNNHNLWNVLFWWCDKNVSKECTWTKGNSQFEIVIEIENCNFYFVRRAIFLVKDILRRNFIIHFDWRMKKRNIRRPKHFERKSFDFNKRRFLVRFKNWKWNSKAKTTKL